MKATTYAELVATPGTIPDGFESDVDEEQRDWESMHCLFDPTETCEHEECVR